MGQEIYSYTAHKPKRRKSLVIITVVLGLIAMGLLAWRLFLNDNSPQTPSSTTTSTSQKPAVAETKQIKGRYLFSGTTVLARRVELYAAGNVNQPFSKMNTFGQFDAREMDLECPVTTSNFSSGGTENPRFNCNTKWLPALKKTYQIIKLAGNHTYDMGADGFKETVANLQSAGFQAIGHYNPHLNKNHNCEVVALPVRIISSNKAAVKAKLPIAFCAFNYKILFDPEPGELELIKTYAKMMPVFGLLQAGAEYQTTAGLLQQNYAHKMIDYGAEFVIANGTHYVQNSESYKGKLIQYSLGNFIFDQHDPETGRGVSIAVDLSIDYNSNVAKWLALSTMCHASKREDTCLQQAITQGLTKISVKMKYEPIANTSGANPVTQKANMATQKAVEVRMGWAQTCSKLIGNVCK